MTTQTQHVDVDRRPDGFVGRTIAGQILLGDLFSTGPFASIYFGRDQRDGAEVAVKRIHADVQPEDAEAMLQAARSVSQFRRARLATVLGAVRESDGTVYIVSERLPGTSLRHLLAVEGPLDPARVTHILMELCAAIAPIHRLGNPHGNLKPENIFVAPQPDGTEAVRTTWTGHFGLVGMRTVANRRLLCGDPRYFSPEQAQGLMATPASDQFTLGVIGYELLTGKRPFPDTDLDQLLGAIAQIRPRSVRRHLGEGLLPAGLDQTIHRCLAKQPEDRFPAIRLLASALNAVLDEPRTVARTASNATPTGPWRFDEGDLQTAEPRAFDPQARTGRMSEAPAPQAPAPQAPAPQAPSPEFEVQLEDEASPVAQPDLEAGSAFDPFVDAQQPREAVLEPQVGAPSQPISPAQSGPLSARVIGTVPVEMEPFVANIEKTLKSAMEINGCVGVALADWQSGMTLGTAGSALNMEVAAAGNTDVVRAKMAVMSQLGIPGGIEDVLITLTTQYHIIMPTGSTLFMYAALDRKTGNLGLARHQMRALVDALTLA